MSSRITGPTYYLLKISTNMANYTKQQIKNLIRKLGYYPKVTETGIMVDAGIGVVKASHLDYFLIHGFTVRTDDVLGSWIEYPLEHTQLISKIN